MLLYKRFLDEALKPVAEMTLNHNSLIACLGRRLALRSAYLSQEFGFVYISLLLRVLHHRGLFFESRCN